MLYIRYVTAKFERIDYVVPSKHPVEPIVYGPFRKLQRFSEIHK